MMRVDFKQNRRRSEMNIHVYIILGAITALILLVLNTAYREYKRNVIRKRALEKEADAAIERWRNLKHPINLEPDDELKGKIWYKDKSIGMLLQTDRFYEVLNGTRINRYVTDQELIDDGYELMEDY